MYKFPAAEPHNFSGIGKRALKMKIDTYTHAEFCTCNDFVRLLENDDDDDDNDRLFIN